MDAISFGPFRFMAAQRLLLEGDKPVRLGSRAFDILAVLLERAGEVVRKEELTARAWPQTFVEDSNLKIQVSALRRTLGDGQGGRRYVVTVPGRGYNFVAPVKLEKSHAPLPPTTAAVAVHNLPLAVTRMIGRGDTVAALVSRLSRERLVTIVGPGGVGKTTVALAVAERMIPAYEHGVWLVDLAPLGDPRLVPSAVAAALGLEMRTEDSLSSVVASLKDKRILLLFDNCEPVVDEAARLAVSVLSGAPGVNILATSREPLGIAGEREYRLGSLKSPQPSAKLTAAEATTYPAVQLFVERASAVVEDFTLTDENASLVSDICRSLDGLPLAIEFAAPRVEVLGVEGLAAHLDDDSLPSLGARRRAAAPRHQTMRAVLDWSYGLLSQSEQPFFRALGIFAGGFTVEAAAAVAMDAAETRIHVMDRLADLAGKSLVIADVSGMKPRFRLLDTTRAYALEKLNSVGEREQMARRHAEYYVTLLECAEAEAPARPTAEWLAEYAIEIDNLRGALDWAFSPTGGASLAVALTTAAVPLWLRLSLFEECRRRAKQALGALETRGTSDRRAEMRLHAAIGASLPDAPEMEAAFTKALDIAQTLDDPEYQLRALRGLYYFSTWTNRFCDSLSVAQRFHNLARSRTNQSDHLLGERMLGTAKYFLGDLVGARRHLEQVLTGYTATDLGQPAVRFQDVIRSQNDGQVEARIFLARVLWLQGLSDQAIRMSEKGLGEAQAIGHVSSQCFALAIGSCAVALLTGNLSAAAEYNRLLIDLLIRHRPLHWAPYGAGYRRIIALKSANVGTSSRPPDATIEEIDHSDIDFRSLTVLTELAEALMRVGRSDEAIAALDRGTAQSPERGCFTPELLRLRGELMLLQTGQATAKPSEDLFRQALDVAHQQAALSWELRAAMSLARLLRNQGRQTEAIACLQPIYDRFTEGFGTADVIAAKRLVDELDN
jgi:predicted ATPase/DNA-binding winged helix-turn-helix (wHTH) protein